MDKLNRLLYNLNSYKRKILAYHQAILMILLYFPYILLYFFSHIGGKNLKYISIYAPPYPFFLYSGDALFRPGDSHAHRSSLGAFDMLFVEYGCLYMVEDGDFYEVNKNEALLLSPTQIHRSYKRCTEETYFHWLHFHTTAPIEISSSPHAKAAPGTGKPNFDYSMENLEIYSIPIHQKIREEAADGLYTDLRALESYSINRYQTGSMKSKESFLHENRLKQQKIFLDILSDVVIHESGRSGSRVAYTIMQLILSDYPQKLSLEDMAEAASCHPVHAIRCFQSEYGTTPGKALTTLRLNKAEELLTTTTLTCEEISEAVGFSSPYYFSRLFKKQFQIPPLQYRKAAGEALK